MATNFGFLPVTTGEHYFISYNTEDSKRVQPIVQALNGAGVPLWYDYGLEYGEEWEHQIARYIHSAKAVIMFVTSGIFVKKRSYVRKEYGIADMYGIKIICVFLDSINGRDIPEQYAGWWQDLRALHGIQSNGESAAQLAEMIIYALDLHQPDSPLKSETVTKKPAVVQPPKPALKVGEYIKLGSYPQSSNTPKPIEWRVLDVRDDGSALVISKYAIDNVKYNESGRACTWETCSLRSWLNGEFLGEAFTAEEQKQILTAAVQNTDNPDYKTKGGNATKDRVFCLSIAEARKHFKNDEDRVAISTNYAEKRGAFSRTCWWWLRSPGDNDCRAAFVLNDGYVSARGYSVGHGGVSVRPALVVRAL